MKCYGELGSQYVLGYNNLMKYPPRPDYSNGQIDRAGIIASTSKPGSKEYADAVAVINKWRAAHGYPIHTFYVTLHRNALLVNKNAIVARRLKRLPTILDKLRSRERGMRLSRMQDIGGLRAIMPTLAHVYKLRDIYTEKGRFSHTARPSHDYIKEPKASGYRGVHLVYAFNNSRGYSRDYDGLNIEIQLRTQLQHEWATAVEVVGTILRTDLKSGRGDKEWLEFFRCMSSVIAIIEDTPVLDVHRGWTTRELISKTVALISKLEIYERILGWTAGLQRISEGSGGFYHILLLNTTEKTIRIIRFEESELEDANKKLAELEEEAAMTGSPEPVLVAAGDINKIKKAYPNYFLDMKDFLEVVVSVIETIDE